MIFPPRCMNEHVALDAKVFFFGWLRRRPIVLLLASNGKLSSVSFSLLFVFSGVVNCAWFPPHTPFVVVKKNVVTVCAASCHSNAIPSLENNWIAWLPTRALAEYFQPATARIMEAAKCHCYRPGRCNFNEPFSDALIRLGQSGKKAALPTTGAPHPDESIRATYQPFNEKPMGIHKAFVLDFRWFTASVSPPLFPSQDIAIALIIRIALIFWFGRNDGQSASARFFSSHLAHWTPCV